ncbi:MAG: metal ABC transporter ATP-binding protein [Planctomycetota bacterium]|nr:MAG: metal ABC transporter ATP-binding protein [Planctomycetota bacterium]
MPSPSAERRPLVALRGATLGYRGAPVLREVDLEVAAGDFLAVVGDNGSGKSTLLRSLLGVLPPLAGDLEREPGLRLGYVPQQLALDPRFPASVEEVARMGLWRRGRSFRRESREDLARVREALERVGLADRAAQAFATLSGGQKQRVLLARALVSAPDLLLLDEPTSGVDARATAAIHACLDELRAAGVGLVLVTHHPLALRGRATHACLVAGGRVRPEDPAELLSAGGAARMLE